MNKELVTAHSSKSRTEGLDGEVSFVPLSMVSGGRRQVEVGRAVLSRSQEPPYAGEAALYAGIGGGVEWLRSAYRARI
jgi:hypothetical protein